MFSRTFALVVPTAFVFNAGWQTTIWWIPGEKESEGRLKRLKGVKYMVTEGNYTLGGEYTMHYADDVFHIVHWKQFY